MEMGIEKILWCKAGEGIAACGKIPEESEIFQDHFPEFPVLPGVLALEMLKKTAEHYLREVHGDENEHYYLKQINSTKFHSYLRPGDAWESRLELIATEGRETHWSAQLLSQGKVAVSAKIILAPSHVPHDPVAPQRGKN